MSHTFTRRAEGSVSLRRRLLAGATAAILTLGMSLGGAGTAFATEGDPVDATVDATEEQITVEPAAVVEPEVEPAVEFTVEPAVTKAPAPVVTTTPAAQADVPCNRDPNFPDSTGGVKYNIGTEDGEVASSGTMSFEWGTLTWTAQQLVFTANPGWTVDLCVKGGSQESNSIALDTGSVTIDRVQDISHFMWANPTPPGVDFCDPSQRPGGVSIAQWLADNEFDGSECFTFTETLQCGSFTAAVTDGPFGYAYQYVEGTDETPVYPASNMPATFSEDYNGGSVDITIWIVGAEQDYIAGTDLPNLWDGTGRTVTINTDCEPPTLPSIDVVAAFTPMTCDVPTGTFRAGLFDPSDANADKLLWTTTQGTVPSADNNAVTTPGTVTVTVRLKDAYVGGDFAVSDTTTLGTPSIVMVGDVETSLITYTFEFTAPTDCDEVIPVVDPFSFVDDCLLGGSYTLEYVEGITYYVTVNGEAPFAVDFAGQPTKTYSANQGDVVSVEPVADEGYVLHPDQPKPFEHTFSTYGEGDCDFPTLANWPASVTVTDEVCTPLGATSGSIGVQFSIGSEENPNPVRYYIAYETAEEQELTTASTSVPAGDYVVTAVATDPTDSINDAGNTAEFEVTVGAADGSDCDLPTLAFTGASELTGAFGIAAVLVILTGMGMVVARRRVEA